MNIALLQMTWLASCIILAQSTTQGILRHSSFLKDDSLGRETRTLLSDLSKVCHSESISFFLGTTGNFFQLKGMWGIISPLSHNLKNVGLNLLDKQACTDKQCKKEFTYSVSIGQKGYTGAKFIYDVLESTG